MRTRSSIAIAALLALGLVPTASAAPKPPPAGGSTAPAQVFFPNPVASLGIESLTDQKDADFFSADPLLATAYHRVTLTNLDGTGTLSGDYAKVLSNTGKAATNTGSGFIYTRDQDQFEQTMAYYWVTQAQLYIQSLGFGSTLPAVNKRQQLLRIDQFGGDNSFFREGTGKLTITLGKGGVDDAEDGEVIMHEYGHSVQDNQVPGFGSSEEAGAIGEGFGDYLSVTVSSAGRAHARRAVRGRLGLDVVHDDGAALPAPRRRHQALSGGPRGRGPRRRRDLVASAVGHPQRARRGARRQDHHRRPVRLRRRHVDDGRGRADDPDGGAVRRPRGARRPRGLRRPRAGQARVARASHAQLQRQGRRPAGANTSRRCASPPPTRRPPAVTPTHRAGTG